MPSIDLGDTTTKTAVLTPHGETRLVADINGDTLAPTCMCRQGTGKLIVARPALQQGYVTPGACARDIKRKLGTSESVINDDPPLTACDAAAAMMAHARESVERAERATVRAFVLTKPVNARDDYSSDLLRAADSAGIEVVRLISEAEGPALNLSLRRPGMHATLGVCDIGGSTCDIAIVRVEDVHLRVLGAAGTSYGGHFFNGIIKARVLSDLQEQDIAIPSRTDDPLFEFDLDERTEVNKRFLSINPETTLTVTVNGRHVPIVISRSWLLEQSQSAFDAWSSAINEGLSMAGIGAQDVDDWILAGGGARPLFAQDVIAAHINRRPLIDEEPEKTVASGAAILCASILAAEGRAAHTVQRAIRAHQFTLHSITTHGLGIATYDRAAGAVVHSVVIQKGTAIPCERTEEYYLEHEDQTTAVVDVLQGEADADQADCVLIGSAQLDNLPKEPMRTRRIKVTFSLDNNGMASVVVTDTVSGQTQDVSINCQEAVLTEPSAAAHAPEHQQQ